MAEYRRSAHAVYDIKYHLIWITKYRYSAELVACSAVNVVTQLYDHLGHLVRNSLKETVSSRHQERVILLVGMVEVWKINRTKV